MDQSRVHATLPGVAKAFTILLGRGDEERTAKSPLHTLEHKLHPWVAFAIMPIFAFANAGLSLGGLQLDSILHPVPLGIFLGLVVGKPVAVSIFSWLAIRPGIAEVPRESPCCI
jgi:NhaA family Na+:H+ antiporter